MASSASLRSLRLKVLYTFDAESKNNCLARWPHVLDVPTAYVDDTTQLGIIDLKTCLQALTSSSPELLSQDATDYTIYAYDYSEEGTPLSGQGMLSSVFGPSAETSAADAAPKMVTGRVTKNILGLFAGNGTETLEVKLRLLPVAKQGLFNRTASPAAAPGWATADLDMFDTASWLNASARPPSVGSASPADTTGLENMQRMLHEGSTPREALAVQSSDSARTFAASRSGSRSGTPSSAQPLNPPSRHQSFSHNTGPASRTANMTTAQPAVHKRRESFNSGYHSAEENQLDENLPRKRAKITQIGAPSRLDLNIERQPESLRMVASTASSVRVHRPNAINTTISNLQLGNSGEDPVRPPTPIPRSAMPVPRRLHSEPSGLIRHSVQGSAPPTTHLSGQPLGGGGGGVDASAASPDLSRAPSVSSTPANFPSSPPIGPQHGSLPSSPALPPPHSAHELEDTRFRDVFDEMSAVNLEIPTNARGLDYGAENAQHNQAAVMPSAATPHNESAPGMPNDTHVQPGLAHTHMPSVSQPPTGQIPVNHPQPARSQASRPAPRPGMSSPRLAPAPYPRARQLEEELSAPAPLPPVPASDPAAGRPFQRSNTWAGEMSDLLTSDAPTGEGGRQRKKKVGREQTKARLENAIAQNEMPPYCDNCGTVDTPAWRRVFAKSLPGYLFDSISLGQDVPGAFVWKQVMEQGNDGSIKTFRAYKLSKNAEDKGDEWSNITLCNPCGLWFHKNKCMRPEEKWGRNPKDPNRKKKRAYRPRSRRVAAAKKDHDGAGDGRSDAPEPASESSSPADGATEGELEADDNGQVMTMVDSTEAKTPAPSEPEPESTTSGRGTGASSFQLPGSSGKAASRDRLSVRGEDFDEVGDAPKRLTPKPLRRQLFPSSGSRASGSSPAASAQARTAPPLAEIPNVCRRSPRLNKTADPLTARPRTPEANKENACLTSDVHDDLFDLFHDLDDTYPAGPPPPQTPTPARRSGRLLSKTPTKTPCGGAAHSASSLTFTAVKKWASHNMAGNDIMDRGIFSSPPGTPSKRGEHEADKSMDNITPASRRLYNKSVQQQPRTTAAKSIEKNGGSQSSPTKTESPMSRHLAGLDGLDSFYLSTTDFQGDFAPPGARSDFGTANHGVLPDHHFGDFLDQNLLDFSGMNLPSSSWMDSGIDVGSCLGGDEEDKGGFLGTATAAAAAGGGGGGMTGLRRSPRKNKARMGG